MYYFFDTKHTEVNRCLADTYGKFRRNFRTSRSSDCREMSNLSVRLLNETLQPTTGALPLKVQIVGLNLEQLNND